MNDRKLVKCSVRLYDEDIETVRSCYPDLGYNKILRTLFAKLAERIRTGRANAVSELEKELVDDRYE